MIRDVTNLTYVEYKAAAFELTLLYNGIEGRGCEYPGFGVIRVTPFRLISSLH